MSLIVPADPDNRPSGIRCRPSSLLPEAEEAWIMAEKKELALAWLLSVFLFRFVGIFFVSGMFFLQLARGLFLIY